MAQRITNRRKAPTVMDDRSGVLHSLVPGESATADFRHEDAQNFPGVEFKDTDEQLPSVRPPRLMPYAEVRNYRPTRALFDLGGDLLELAPKGKPGDCRRVRNLDPETTRLEGVVTRALTLEEYARSDKEKADIEAQEKAGVSPKFFADAAALRAWAATAPFRALQAFARGHGVSGASRSDLTVRLQKAMFGA